MSSVEKRERNGKTTYVVRYRDLTRKQRAKSFSRKADADKYAHKVEADMERGSYIDPAKARLTLAQYAALWRSQLTHKPLTGESMANHLDRHLLPSLGHLRLSELGPAHVKAWLADAARGRAASSVNVTLGYLRALLISAVEDGYLPKLPIPRKLRLQEETRLLVPLTPEEVAAWIDKTPNHYKAYLVLCAGCGLRQGEALGLTVDRIDFIKSEVRIDRQLVCPKKAERGFASPKSAASVRTVPMPKVVSGALLAHIKRYGTGEHGLLFPNTKGGFTHNNTVGKAVGNAAVRAGLPKGTTSHDLRHFYASLLIHKGQSVKAVQRRLGHASAVTTLNTYAHLWPDSEEETREAIDCVLGMPSQTADAVY